MNRSIITNFKVDIAIDSLKLGYQTEMMGSKIQKKS